MAGKILNFGSLNIDYVYTVDHIVKEGETIASTGYHIFEGGKGLNQSVALARAGSQIFHAGKIGKEGFFLKNTLEAEGVDCRFLKTGEGSNGHAIIQCSEAGENSIVLYPGSNHEITREDMEEVLEQFGEGDILVCQNEISNMPFLIEAASERGMKIVWNPSPVTDIVNKIDFHRITWLIINEIEGGCITGKEEPGEILKSLKEKYPNLTVVLTLGKQGAVYQSGEESGSQPAFTVPVRDTTAAGDTFLGYFISNLMRNHNNWKEAMKMASMASAMAVEKQGAVPSIPRKEEVEGRLETK